MNSTSFNLYVTSIILFKLVYFSLAIGHIHFKINNEKNKTLDNIFVYGKNFTGFTFVFLIAALLIFIFNPFINNLRFIDNEVKWILFMLGFLLLFTNNWELFLDKNFMSTIRDIF